MALHVMDEANRCLQCKVPQCQKGCPINTNIPVAIRLLKENKLNEAGKMLFENNPLTTVCSLVCNHEKQCEGHCVLGRKGAPVHFSSIENYISTTYANMMTNGPAKSNGMRVAIIGSGPAGITIAIILARYGYQVTIFEGKDKIGGVLRYGIPEFRLPKSVLDDIEYRHLELKGIKIRPNTLIGSAISIDDLFRDGYKSIFVGTGVWKPNSLHIKGETFGNVHFGINYLNNPDSYRLGERVIVIGAQLEGVQFEYNKKPIEIKDNGVIFKDVIENEDGSFTEVDGTETLYESDSVIISISQGPQNRLVSNTNGLKSNARGLLEADETGHTSRPGIFASGDVVNGARTVVEAVAHSKIVAESMHEYMQSLPKDESL